MRPEQLFVKAVLALGLTACGRASVLPGPEVLDASGRFKALVTGRTEI